MIALMVHDALQLSRHRNESLQHRRIGDMLAPKSPPGPGTWSIRSCAASRVVPHSTVEPEYEGTRVRIWYTPGFAILIPRVFSFLYNSSQRQAAGQKLEAGEHRGGISIRKSQIRNPQSASVSSGR